MAELISPSEAEELTQARKLIDEGKLDKAHSLLTNFEENRGKTPYNVVLCKFLKCQVFRYQGLFEKALKLAEQTYNESLELGEKLLSIDILLLMAEVLSTLHMFEKVNNIIIQGEELLNRLPQKSVLYYKQREAHIAFQKGLYYREKINYDRALGYFEHSLAIREEIGIKQDIAQSLIYKSDMHLMKSEIDYALKYVEQGLALAKESKVKWLIVFALNSKGDICAFKGELDHSIMVFKQSLAISKQLDNIYWLAATYNDVAGVYMMKGQLDHALEYIENALELYIKLGLLPGIALVSDFLIQILIEKGEIKRAKQCLDRMEQIKNEISDKTLNIWYSFDKALILKTSPLARNRGKAEEILKEILKEEDLQIDMKIRVFLNLCELLLTELQLTNDADVLGEIKSLITQLLDLSEKSHSSWVLGETYLLQSKLALISLHLEDAQRFLTQGQKTAEKYGLHLLAQKISNEHDEFLKQSKIWEDIKESETTITERMRLARINDQMKNMVSKRILEVPEPTDEDPIVLLIISEGGRPLFSESFAEEWAFEDHLFGGFLTAINSFSDEMFSKGLDRANFGEYTIIMNALDPFLVCYLFKGQSYLAQQRVAKFIDHIKDDAEIWKTFHKFNQACQLVQLKDIPSLKPLIHEIFIDRSVPLIT